MPDVDVTCRPGRDRHNNKPRVGDLLQLATLRRRGKKKKERKHPNNARGWKKQKTKKKSEFGRSSAFEAKEVCQLRLGNK